jgi:rhodanese-related sulfurtransferase
VRNPGETAGGTLASARTIPLATLIDSLDRLDRAAPVVVHCAGGYRSLIAASVLRDAGATLIDAREPDEWATGHAPTARLIPMSQVERRLDEIRGIGPALVVCRSGGRSAAITQLLSAAGIDAVNLAGGMQAWAAVGLPVVTDAGEPGRIA